MKRTYQPSKLVRKRRHGFRARMATRAAGSCSRGGEQRGASACRLEAGGPFASPVTAIGRLKTRAEFLHVRGGERYTAPSLVLQARRRERRVGEEPSLDPHVARFGFTATKTLGGAVVRNRARRRLKEAVRLAGRTPRRGGL